MEARQFYVDERSTVPLYVQLGEQVLAAVARGELRRGDRLPSVRDVAGELALNPLTVNRAYAELEREGVLETRRGLGTFVAGLRKRKDGAAVPALADIAGRFVSRARALGYEGRQIVSAVQTHVGATSAARRGR
jgi:GntR family transcriptional regulator